MGGQGIFVKEVQAAVLDGRADIAVHSAKDLPGTQAEGLHIVAVPERADARDVLVGARLDEPTNLLCADVLLPPTTAEPAGLGADPFLDALAEQCFAGDLLDCDLLFAEAETGSAYERFGASCAGRVSADTTRDCTELLD